MEQQQQQQTQYNTRNVVKDTPSKAAAAAMGSLDIYVVIDPIRPPCWMAGTLTHHRRRRRRGLVQSNRKRRHHHQDSHRIGQSMRWLSLIRFAR